MHVHVFGRSLAGLLLVSTLVAPSHAQRTATPGAATSAAMAGGLDTSFGTGGTLVTAASAFDDQAKAIVAQPDGKLVVAGWAEGETSEDFVLVRYFGDGRLDPTFDGDGIVLTDFGGEDRASALVLQPDGSLVAAGKTDTDGSADFALARYLPNGQLDPAFGRDGTATTNFFPGSGEDSFGSDDEAVALVLQADGKLIAAGHTVRCDEIDCDSAVALARYLPNGRLDTSFNGDGKVETDLGGSLDEARALVLQADGKAVVAGTDGESFALARYQTNGSLDPAFTGDGTVTTSFGSSEAEASGLAVQPDGKLVVAGQVADGGNIALARYLSDGRMDSTFSGDGIVIVDFGGDDRAAAVLVDADSRLVVAGTTDVSTTRDVVLARFQPDGSPDATFGPAGKIVTDVGGRDQAFALVRDPDSKLVVVGTTHRGGFDDIMLARYLVAVQAASHRVFLPLVLSDAR